ncbi:hypothetical protein ACFXJO_02145 [Streptomyces lavendulae]|uniref:hypothetical protein n=1 Tax=Streptomyces lavendulae TaxID=1914 RepID=UPI00368A5780
MQTTRTSPDAGIAGDRFFEAPAPRGPLRHTLTVTTTTRGGARSGEAPGRYAASDAERRSTRAPPRC